MTWIIITASCNWTGIYCWLDTTLLFNNRRQGPRGGRGNIQFITSFDQKKIEITFENYSKLSIEGIFLLFFWVSPLSSYLIGAAIKLYLLIIRIVKMETWPNHRNDPAQSTRFSFNTFQFPLDFIRKARSVWPGNIFCQSSRKRFCEMKYFVFCIVSANLNIFEWNWPDGHSRAGL